MTWVSPEKERLEVALGHAWLRVLPALAFLCACRQDPTDYWQGYVEGEYIYVSAAGSGTLLERHVVRGGRVRRGAPSFKLEQDREIAIRDEALARLQGALATLEDLQQGKRSEELDIIEAQLAQARLKGAAGVEQVTAFGDTLHVSGTDAAALDHSLAPLRDGYAWNRIDPGLEMCLST